MALIKCQECGKEISSNAAACIHCGKVLEKHYTSSIDETEKNINFFLKLAKVVKVVAYIIAVILLMIGIMSGEGEIFVMFLIFGVIVGVAAFLSTPFLEWKAYVLKNIYEINQKGK